MHSSAPNVHVLSSSQAQVGSQTVFIARRSPAQYAKSLQHSVLSGLGRLHWPSKAHGRPGVASRQASSHEVTTSFGLSSTLRSVVQLAATTMARIATRA